jgi:Pentapeptide repeats (8 copies)
MVFTVLDCCYSGADKLSKGSAKGSSKAQEESAIVAKDTIKEKSGIPGEGKCVLAACKPMQKAFEYKEKGHSFFSYYLSEALTSQECIDKDGDVTPYALNTYIDNKIRSLPAEIRPKQTPFLNCLTAGKIVLAHYAKEVPPGAIESKGSKSDYLLKLLQEEKIEEFNKIRKEGDVPLYLRGVDLRGKNLGGVDLHEVDLTDAKFIGTKLTTANLNSAKLKGADLSGADLRSADLYGASLSGSNLTRADLRGADLTGMVNFAGAKLHDVDFTGSATDKGLINFFGADVRNAKGLPVLHEPNEYLEGLKSFSESIKQQFKTYNIPAEEVKPIEESVKELVEEVKDIQEPEEIDGIKKKNINLKFVDMAKRVIKSLPTKEAETLRIFTPLIPFAKIIGQEVPQIIGSIQKSISGTTTDIEDHVEPEVKTTGSPFYQDKTTSAEKESEPIIKKPAFEANPPPVTPKAYPVDKKNPGRSIQS